TYADLNFDKTDKLSIKDAFETTLVDGQGKPLVHAFQSARDALFNITEDQAPAMSQEASLQNQTVTVDLSQVPPGTSATLIIRLMNNDRDTNTSVRIPCVQFPMPDQPPTVTVALANDTAPSGPGSDPYRTDLLTNDATISGTASDDIGVS